VSGASEPGACSPEAWSAGPGRRFPRRVAASKAADQLSHHQQALRDYPLPEELEASRRPALVHPQEALPEQHQVVGWAACQERPGAACREAARKARGLPA
jgi:hypothetical protein